MTPEENPSPTSESCWLEFSHVSAGYNGSPVVEDITFTVPRGARVAVVGPNGAGKSTLFRLMVRSIPLQSGTIRIHGEPAGKYRHCVAYIPQRNEVDWRFPVTVRDVVEMGRYGRGAWFHPLRKRDQLVVMRNIELLGLAELSKSSIAELSGGQQQRVFLARALTQEPHILLMDEPLNGVDLTTQEAIFSLLDEMRKTAVTVLFATHDLTLAATKFDFVALLNHRLIAFGPPKDVLCHEHIQQAFGGHALVLGELVVVDHCCPE
jgi:ABC-type Mn2+/Zn2+ transport system ATPase subunit